MQTVQYIAGWFKFSAGVLGVMGLTIPLAAAAILTLSVVAAGLLLFPLVGSAAWDPAVNILRAAEPQQLEGAALLVGALPLLLVIAGFGFWCLNWAKVSSGFTRIFSRTARPLLLAAAALTQTACYHPAANPLIAFPHRVTRLTSAGLTGASPHLE